MLSLWFGVVSGWLTDRSGKGSIASSSSRGGRREAVVVASLGCEAPDTELYIGA
jgi:hypothetical protein